MGAVEGSGRTIAEAVEAALAQLGVSRDQVTVEVLQEPRLALLGFGGREARVRLSPLQADHEVARDVTGAVLGLMGQEAQVETAQSEEGVRVVVEGEDLGGVIGKNGRTLDALEFLVSLHVQKRLRRRVALTVDAMGYRAKHERVVVQAAARAAERAVAEGISVALEPMGPRDRRVVHLALRDDARVTTESSGEDPSRHVVVAPSTPGGARRPTQEGNQHSTLPSGGIDGPTGGAAGRDASTGGSPPDPGTENPPDPAE